LGYCFDYIHRMDAIAGIMKFVMVFFLLGVLSYGSDCDYTHDHSTELSTYQIRIDNFITKNSLSCDVLYAYELVLGDEQEMIELENDIDYAKQLGAFVKDYPYMSKLCSSKIIFQKLNNYNLESKDSIEATLKIMHSDDKRNILYVLMALNAQTENIDKERLESDLKRVQNMFSLDDLKLIMPYWTIYYEFYEKNKSSQNTHDLFEKFLEIVKVVGLKHLEKYNVYRDEFFPYFMAEDYTNIAYTETINELLSLTQAKDEYKLFFLKTTAHDIEQTLNQNNYTKEEIIGYFGPLVKNEELIAMLSGVACDNPTSDEERDLPLVISNTLDAKLDFIRGNERFYSQFIDSFNKKSVNEQIALISYFNYLTMLYQRLSLAEVSKQKNIAILDDLLNNLTNDKLFNMRSIMIISEYSSYFDDLVNDNWKNNKHREIFYLVRDDVRLLDSLKGQNFDENKFQNEITELIRTSNENLDDMTSGEIFERTIDTLDYATMVIPGMGIGVYAFKQLAKKSIMLGIKQVAKYGIKKTIKRQVIKGARFMKENINDYLEDRVKYGDRRTKSVKIMNNSVKNMAGVEDTLTISAIALSAYSSFYDQTQQQTLCKEQ